MAAAFATYFCMFAFRKPFTVATFAGSAELPLLPPLPLKTLFIVAQVLGYCASKFSGIKVVSEMRPERRALAILGCIAMAELALVLFAVAPPPYNAICLVVNGLPLGMVWGLVFGFLEGRGVSDVLGAGLCASFIVADGFVKTVGKRMMAAGVGEYWMPAATGALFLLPIAAFVALLAQLPPPSAEDEAQRTRRAPMDKAARRAFFRAYAPGLVALTAGYMVLTAYRDFRSNFAREIWDAVGYAKEPDILTKAELPVAIGSVLSVALIMGIRRNARALLAIYCIMVTGALLVGVSSLLYQAGVIGPAAWMICVGLGLYMGYVPVNCVLFDRLIAAVGSVATAGFLIYMADAFGYLGSVALLLYKNFGRADLSWLEFFLGFSYVDAVLCAGLFAASAAYFWGRTRDR
jgi:hypothetical protein